MKITDFSAGVKNVKCSDLGLAVAQLSLQAGKNGIQMIDCGIQLGRDQRKWLVAKKESVDALFCVPDATKSESEGYFALPSLEKPDNGITHILGLPVTWVDEPSVVRLVSRSVSNDDDDEDVFADF